MHANVDSELRGRLVRPGSVERADARRADPLGEVIVRTIRR
jgi:hypothetical protein